MSVVELSNVSKCFANNTYGLQGVDLAVAQGEILAVVGPNGSGKTTLMKCVAGLYSPTEGGVSVASELGALPFLSLMLESSGLFDHFSVLQNLHYYADLTGFERAQLEEQFASFLSEFELPEFHAKLVKTLSAGERRMVSLFRSVFFGPRLLLLDEPTAHLDPTNQIRVTSFIRNLRDRTGATVLFSSHNLADVSHVADRIVFLKRGRLVLGVNRDELAKYRLVVREVSTDGEQENIVCSNGFEMEGKLYCLMDESQLASLGPLGPGVSVRQPDLREFYACVYQ